MVGEAVVVYLVHVVLQSKVIKVNTVYLDYLDKFLFTRYATYHYHY